MRKVLQGLEMFSLNLGTWEQPLKTDLLFGVIIGLKILPFLDKKMLCNSDIAIVAVL